MQLQVAVALDPGLGAVTSVGLHDWGADPWALGAYTVPVSGIDDASRRWAEPVDGVLFFAGEATADRGLRGLVQGAISSGLRAARDLLNCARSCVIRQLPDRQVVIPAGNHRRRPHRRSPPRHEGRHRVR